MNKKYILRKIQLMSLLVLTAANTHKTGCISDCFQGLKSMICAPQALSPRDQRHQNEQKQDLSTAYQNLIEFVETEIFHQTAESLRFTMDDVHKYTALLNRVLSASQDSNPVIDRALHGLIHGMINVEINHTMNDCIMKQMPEQAPLLNKQLLPKTAELISPVQAFLTLCTYGCGDARGYGDRRMCENMNNQYKQDMYITFANFSTADTEDVSMASIVLNEYLPQIIKICKAYIEKDDASLQNLQQELNNPESQISSLMQGIVTHMGNRDFAQNKANKANEKVRARAAIKNAQHDLKNAEQQLSRVSYGSQQYENYELQIKDLKQYIKSQQKILTQENAPHAKVYSFNTIASDHKVPMRGLFGSTSELKGISAKATFAIANIWRQSEPCIFFNNTDRAHSILFSRHNLPDFIKKYPNYKQDLEYFLPS